MPERRHLPRAALEAVSSGAVACVRIDPDIVGIIMDICAEGLGFQCMTPLERNGTVRFSLMQSNRSMDGCGELAWLDATGTSGGLRFTTLTAEAREQISEWVSQSSIPTGEVRASTPAAASRSLGEPCPAMASPSVIVATGAEGTSEDVGANRADRPHQTARSRLGAGNIVFRRTWEWARAALRQQLRRRWRALLDSIRLQAISAEIEEIYRYRYQARLKAAVGEERQRLGAQFLKDREALEQERLTIASRRAVRAAERLNIYIPGEKFKYNGETNTFILAEPDRLRLQRRVMQERRLRMEARALWAVAILAAVVALALVWLATTLKGCT